MGIKFKFSDEAERARSKSSSSKLMAEALGEHISQRSSSRSK